MSPKINKVIDLNRLLINHCLGSRLVTYSSTSLSSRRNIEHEILRRVSNLWKQRTIEHDTFKMQFSFEGEDFVKIQIFWKCSLIYVMNIYSSSSLSLKSTFDMGGRCLM